ncbi:hypothetical protein ACHAO9_009422 [Fusarium lateritium]
MFRISKLKWLRLLHTLHPFTRHAGSGNIVYAREGDSWYPRAQQAIFLHIDTSIGGSHICSIKDDVLLE